jgi:snapalysin
MSIRRSVWTSIGALLLTIVTAQLVSPGTATAAPSTAAARILYYDASRAGEFVAAVNQGADNWNSSVINVQLRPAPAGVRPNIRIIVDNGWPRASVRSLGNGTIWMGRQAVNQGHYPPRITAHEFGHLLGLPDRRTGRCTDLMSGSSARASCRNDMPNSAERASVERRFAGSLVANAPTAATYTWR